MDGRGGGRGRRPVRLRPRRRPRAPRPALAPPARRPRRGERRRRPGGLHLAQRVGGARTAGCRPVRAAHRHVHPGGHLRRRCGAPAPPRRAGHHPCVADARLPVPRRPRVGVRGGVAVGRARAVRRPGGYEALCRHGARARSRGGPRRGPQPPGPVRQPPPGVRPVLHRHPPHTVGRRDQPRRLGLRRGPRVPARQCTRLAARLPARRTAARRRPRPRRHPGPHVPGGAVHGGRRPLYGARPPAAPDRRVRPLRPAHDDAARDGRDRSARPVERRLPPRPAHRPDRRGPGLLRRLRRCPDGRPRQDRDERLLPRRHVLQLPRPHTAAPSTPSAPRPPASSALRRPTTRSATGHSATGSPPRSPPVCWPARRRWC